MIHMCYFLQILLLIHVYQAIMDTGYTRMLAVVGTFPAVNPNKLEGINIHTTS